MSTPIRIIIADDHPLCLSGFRKLLELPGLKLIGEAANGKELIDLTRELKPDIIITDIKMPHMDGIVATKQLTKEFPDIGIIALSIIDEYSLIMEMIEAGAKGYLLKSAHVNDIIAAIQTVYKGETYYCRDTTAQMVKMLAKSDYISLKKNIIPHFSERESDIIKLICQSHSNKEIAKQLNITKRTVEWHREHILQKLDANNTAGIVAFAIKNNLC